MLSDSTWIPVFSFFIFSRNGDGDGVVKIFHFCWNVDKKKEINIKVIVKNQFGLEKLSPRIIQPTKLSTSMENILIPEAQASWSVKPDSSFQAYQRLKTRKVNKLSKNGSEFGGSVPWTFGNEY